MKAFQNMMQRMLTNRKTHIRTVSFITALSLIMMFIMPYAEIVQAADTDVTTTAQELICDIEEHTHTDECFSLICEDDSEEHEHTEDCYETICGIEEHTHSEDCYKTVEVTTTEAVEEVTEEEVSISEMLTEMNINMASAVGSIFIAEGENNTSSNTDGLPRLTGSYSDSQFSYYFTPFDENHFLGPATNFHLFAFDTIDIGAHCNGNFAAPNVSGNSVTGNNQIKNAGGEEISLATNTFTLTGGDINSAVLLLPEGVVVKNERGDPVQTNPLSKVKIIGTDNKATDHNLPEGGQIYHVGTDFVDWTQLKTSFINKSNSYATNDGKIELIRTDPEVGATGKQKIGGDNNDGRIYTSETSSAVYYNISANDLNYYSKLTLYGTDENRGFDNTRPVIISVDLAGINTSGSDGKPSFTVNPEITVKGHSAGEDSGVNNGWNILWNFYDSSKADYAYDGTITFQKVCLGSVLAPKAQIDAGANVDGTLIGNNVNTRAETHKSTMGQSITTYLSFGITVQKQWANGATEQPVTIGLYRSSSQTDSNPEAYPSDKQQTITLSDDNNWTATFNDLIKKEGNNDWYYFVREMTTGYTVSYSETSGINKNKSVQVINAPGQSGNEGPATISISAKKEWNDGSAKHAGQSVKVRLYYIENYTKKYVYDQTLDSTNNWSCRWDNLEKDKTYFIEEVDCPDGYSEYISPEGGLGTNGIFNLTNKKTRMNLTVNKEWLNATGEVDNSENTQVKLWLFRTKEYFNATELKYNDNTIKTFVADHNGEWLQESTSGNYDVFVAGTANSTPNSYETSSYAYTFSNLETEDENGNKYYYYIYESEESRASKITSYVNNGLSVDAATTEIKVQNKPQTFSIKAQKLWNMNGTGTATPNTYVVLQKNSSGWNNVIGNDIVKQLNSENNYSVEYNDITYENGAQYRIVECNAEGTTFYTVENNNSIRLDNNNYIVSYQENTFTLGTDVQAGETVFPKITNTLQTHSLTINKTWTGKDAPQTDVSKVRVDVYRIAYKGSEAQDKPQGAKGYTAFTAGGVEEQLAASSEGSTMKYKVDATKFQKGDTIKLRLTNMSKPPSASLVIPTDYGSNSASDFAHMAIPQNALYANHTFECQLTIDSVVSPTYNESGTPKTKDCYLIVYDGFTSDTKAYLSVGEGDSSYVPVAITTSEVFSNENKLEWVKTVELEYNSDSTKSWKATLTDLPANNGLTGEDERTYKYFIRETALSKTTNGNLTGYSFSSYTGVSGTPEGGFSAPVDLASASQNVDISNTYNSENTTTSLTVRKIWQNVPTGVVLSDVRIKLMVAESADGNYVYVQENSSEVTRTLSPNGTTTFNGLDPRKYYKVVEVPETNILWDVNSNDLINIQAAGQTVNLVNTYKTIDVTVVKTWSDSGHESERPSSLTLKLKRKTDGGTTWDYVNPNPIPTVYKDSTTGKWTFKFNDLPAYDNNGNSLSYTVEEVVPSGYNQTATAGSATSVNYETRDDSIGLTNSYVVIPKISLKVQKKWSDGDENHYNTPIQFVIKRSTDPQDANTQNGEVVANDVSLEVKKTFTLNGVSNVDVGQWVDIVPSILDNVTYTVKYKASENSTPVTVEPTTVNGSNKIRLFAEKAGTYEISATADGYSNFKATKTITISEPSINIGSVAKDQEIEVQLSGPSSGNVQVKGILQKLGEDDNGNDIWTDVGTLEDYPCSFTNGSCTITEQITQNGTYRFVLKEVTKGEAITDDDSVTLTKAGIKGQLMTLYATADQNDTDIAHAIAEINAGEKCYLRLKRGSDPIETDITEQISIVSGGECMYYNNNGIINTTTGGTIKLRYTDSSGNTADLVIKVKSVMRIKVDDQEVSSKTIDIGDSVTFTFIKLEGKNQYNYNIDIKSTSGTEKNVLTNGSTSLTKTFDTAGTYEIIAYHDMEGQTYISKSVFITVRPPAPKIQLSASEGTHYTDTYITFTPRMSDSSQVGTVTYTIDNDTSTTYSQEDINANYFTAGSHTITATNSSGSDSIQIDVAEPYEIVLSEEPKVGNNVTLTLNHHGTAVSSGVSFTSSDPDKATISGNTLQGVATGEVTITASVDNESVATKTINIAAAYQEFSSRANTFSNVTLDTAKNVESIVITFADDCQLANDASFLIYDSSWGIQIQVKYSSGVWAKDGNCTDCSLNTSGKVLTVSSINKNFSGSDLIFENYYNSTPFIIAHLDIKYSDDLTTKRYFSRFTPTNYTESVIQTQSPNLDEILSQLSTDLTTSMTQSFAPYMAEAQAVKRIDRPLRAGRITPTVGAELTSDEVSELFFNTNVSDTITLGAPVNKDPALVVTFVGGKLRTSSLKKETVELTATGVGQWIKTISNLPATDGANNPYYYWVEEVDIPTGYTPSYSYKVGKGEETSSAIDANQVNQNSEGIMVITNTKQEATTSLPESGGGGTKLIYTIGAMLLMMSGAGYTMYKRRRWYDE